MGADRGCELSRYRVGQTEGVSLVGTVWGTVWGYRMGVP